MLVDAAIEMNNSGKNVEIECRLSHAADKIVEWKIRWKIRVKIDLNYFPWLVVR